MLQNDVFFHAYVLKLLRLKIDFSENIDIFRTASFRVRELERLRYSMAVARDFEPILISG